MSDYLRRSDVRTWRGESAHRTTVDSGHSSEPQGVDRPRTPERAAGSLAAWVARMRT